VDFGLPFYELMKNRLSSLTNPKEMIKYCAPETLNNGVLSIKSNIYTFGLICYEVLREKQVFLAQSIEFILHYNSSQTPFFSLHESTEKYDNLISQFLAFNPEERPYFGQINWEISYE